VIFEIVGVFEHNKGALLMLEAIRERIRADFPDAEFAVSSSMSKTYRREQKLLGVLQFGQGMRSRLKLLLPRFILRRQGLVKPSEVDVVLDASGFGYGDFWGLGKLETRLVGKLRHWKKPGKVAVLLPQALGPFETDGMGEAFRKALGRLDLVFVRDRVSLRHVRAVAPEGSNIHSAPDFTNLLHPPLSARHAGLVGHSFVIPNEKMVAGERSASRPDYVRFMATAVKAIARSGRTVDLLIHEGPKDRALADEINAALPEPIAVIDAASPLETKAIIASADLIVSSRFHGLVSALSNAVPSLACGWSHKYAELMTDYGAPDLIVDIGREEYWAPRLQALLDAASSPLFRASLKQAADAQKLLSGEMWTQTIAAIRKAA